MNLSCNVESDIHKYNHALPLAAQSMVVCLTEYMQSGQEQQTKKSEAYFEKNICE